MQRSLAFVVALVGLLALPLSPARAQLTIEIVGGAGAPLPIAVVPFEGEARYPVSVTSIVGADLARSGLFKVIDGDSVTPRATRPEDVQLGSWRSKGADAVVVGTAKPLPDGRVEIRYALVDTVKQVTLESQIYTVTPAQLKITAHKIADTIYEKLTGDPGVFSTRIAYITKQGTRYQLMVADADGSEPQTIVTSVEPLLSPRWSPEGTRIAYVSFESKKPVVYVQNLSNGSRAAVANFRGSNSSPAWSPDGKKLAVTLSKDGGSQLYLMNADGSDAQRVMTSNSIDTEADFMPDGRSILFTSDRGGTPQIYQLTLRKRRGRPAHVRRQLQRLAAASAGRQELHVRAPRRRQVPDRHAGLRVAAGAGADRRAARRVAQRRPERQADPLRERGRGAWYIGRGLERRPREAASVLHRHRRARTRVGAVSAALDLPMPRPRMSPRCSIPRAARAVSAPAIRSRRLHAETDHRRHRGGRARRLQQHAHAGARRGQVARPRRPARPAHRPAARRRRACPARPRAPPIR